MGIKKVLLSLGLCTLVSVSGMAMANAKAAPENDDRAQQECPEGEKCDHPATDQKKLKKMIFHGTSLLLSKILKLN